MLDLNPALSICPEVSHSFPGQTGLVLYHADGQPLLTKFRFQSAEETKSSLALTYNDEANGLTYRAEFSINAATHVIEAKASVSANSPSLCIGLRPLCFPRLSPVMRYMIFLAAGVVSFR